MDELTSRAHQASEIDGKLSSLAPRERTITLLVLQGFDSNQVAKELGIKPASVRTTLHRVYQKLEVNGMAELRREYAQITHDMGEQKRAVLGASAQIQPSGVVADADASSSEVAFSTRLLNCYVFELFSLIFLLVSFHSLRHSEVAGISQAFVLSGFPLGIAITYVLWKFPVRRALEIHGENGKAYGRAFKGVIAAICLVSCYLCWLWFSGRYPNELRFEFVKMCTLVPLSVWVTSGILLVVDELGASKQVDILEQLLLLGFAYFIANTLCLTLDSSIAALCFLVFAASSFLSLLLKMTLDCLAPKFAMECSAIWHEFYHSKSADNHLTIAVCLCAMFVSGQLVSPAMGERKLEGIMWIALAAAFVLQFLSLNHPFRSARRRIFLLACMFALLLVGFSNFEILAVLLVAMTIALLNNADPDSPNSITCTVERSLLLICCMAFGAMYGCIINGFDVFALGSEYFLVQQDTLAFWYVRFELLMNVPTLALAVLSGALLVKGNRGRTWRAIMQKADSDEHVRNRARAFFEYRGLSDMEAGVAFCCLQGKTVVETARALNYSPSAIKVARSAVFAKLNVKNVQELRKLYLQVIEV